MPEGLSNRVSQVVIQYIVGDCVPGHFRQPSGFLFMIADISAKLAEGTTGLTNFGGLVLAALVWQCRNQRSAEWLHSVRTGDLLKY